MFCSVCFDCFARKSFCFVLQEFRGPGVIHGECEKFDFLGCTVISGNERLAQVLYSSRKLLNATCGSLTDPV